MRLKVIEQTPPIFCSQEAIKKLEDEGIYTSGWIEHLKWLIAKNGLKMPYEYEGGYRFDLIDENKKLYTFIYLNLVDAIAEKLILINEK